MGFIDYVAEYFRGPAGEPGPAGPAGPAGGGAYVMAHGVVLDLFGESFKVSEPIEGSNPTDVPVAISPVTELSGSNVTGDPGLQYGATTDVAYVNGSSFPNAVTVTLSAADMDSMTGTYAGEVYIVWLPTA